MKVRATLVTMLCVVLSGCASEEEDIKAWMNQESKSMKGTVKPLPQMTPFPIPEYLAEGVIEPFAAVRLIPDQRTPGSGGGLVPDLTRPREPLEAYPLESLSMVGALLQGRQAHALIQVDGAIHQVRVGNYLGQSFGVVTSITETEVTLRELVQDVNGDWVERSSSLLLLEQQEAKK
jgi:type IV pilus assembly protein PilP